MAVILITAGAILASVNNLLSIKEEGSDIMIKGYIWASLSNISTALLLEYSNYLNVK